MTEEEGLEVREAVLRALGGIIFVVNALWAGWRCEVGVVGLLGRM